MWDVAGAVVEWRMDEGFRKRFIEALHQRNLQPTLATLDRYILAYIAFRLGVLEFSGIREGSVVNSLREIALGALGRGSSGLFNWRAADRDRAEQNKRKKDRVSLERKVELGVEQGAGKTDDQ